MSDERHADIPWDEQRALFQRCRPQIIDNLCGFIRQHSDEILSACDERLEDGYHMYGSRMFSWSEERCDAETIEENADGCLYLFAKYAKRLRDGLE
jgi:hypothetical protein